MSNKPTLDMVATMVVTAGFSGERYNEAVSTWRWY
jgi:hypothetical protein